MWKTYENLLYVDHILKETIGFPHLLCEFTAGNRFTHFYIIDTGQPPEGYVMPSWLEQKDATGRQHEVTEGDEGTCWVDCHN